MALLLGVVAGLAFGLSAFAGAFVALPLLVVGAGIGIQASLPVALLSLGICAGIAAGDAVRARQCDVTLVAVFLIGAAPATLIVAWMAQNLAEDVLATLFLICAIIFGPLLIRTVRRFRFRLMPCPAALLNAPRREWRDVASARVYSWNARRRVALAGAGCGVLAALCAAPGSWLGGRALDREMPGQSFQVAGTLVFAVALLAILESGVQFLLAPAVPGYTAGLYVLGAVAGMGLARRIERFAVMRHSNNVVGVLVIVAAMLLWVAVVNDWGVAT